MKNLMLLLLMLSTTGVVKAQEVSSEKNDKRVKKKIIIVNEEEEIETSDLKGNYPGDELIGKYDLGEGDIDTTIIETDENGNERKVVIKRRMGKDEDGNQLQKHKVIMISDGEDKHEEIDIDIDIEKLMESIEVETGEDGEQRVIIREISTEDQEGAEEMLKEMGIDIDIDDENGERSIRVEKVVMAKLLSIEDLEEGDQLLEENKVDLKNKLELKDLKIAPNPNNGEFQVSFKSDSDKKTLLNVFNIDGKRVFDIRLNQTNGVYTTDVDLKDVAKGVYLLQIIQGNQQMNKKILIQ